MKELGQRRTGVPGRWSLAFLPPEGQVTSNRKTKQNCEPFTAQSGEGGASSQSDWGDQDPHSPALGVYRRGDGVGSLEVFLVEEEQAGLAGRI